MLFTRRMTFKILYFWNAAAFNAFLFFRRWKILAVRWHSFSMESIFQTIESISNTWFKWNQIHLPMGHECKLVTTVKIVFIHRTNQLNGISMWFVATRHFSNWNCIFAGRCSHTHTTTNNTQFLQQPLLGFKSTNKVFDLVIGADWWVFVVYVCVQFTCLRGICMICA